METMIIKCDRLAAGARRPTAIGVLLLGLFACLVAPLAAQGGPAKETRLALVIGNGDYKNIPLKNPPNDARDLALALKGLDFDVTLVVNGDFKSMTRAIREFGAAIKRPDAVALFYYSGHGVQYKGANYLVPAKSDIQDADELAFAAVNADQVYAKMESAGCKTNIVILDACRNNPFAGSERGGERGLAIVGSAPPQSIVVYSTAPGKTAQDGEGRNGVFTSALLKHIGEPGVDIEFMLRDVRSEVIAKTNGAQVPWHNSSISGSGFSFAPRAAAPRQEAPAVEAKAAAPQKPGLAAGKGKLTITSDPPGMLFLMDGMDAYATPVSLELAPGAHSFEPKQTIIDGKYYADQPAQWVTVAEGAEASIPIKLLAARGRLELRRVPDGCEVTVNGQACGTTPRAANLDVPAGELKVSIDRAGREPVGLSAIAKPGETTILAWGSTRATAAGIPVASIKLDGTKDSWKGIAPAHEAKRLVPFMGGLDSGIERVYLARDDTFLYWRVDFARVNPLAKRPKGVTKQLTLQLDFPGDDGRYSYWISSFYKVDGSKFESQAGKNELNGGKWQLLKYASSGRNEKDFFAGRVDLAWLRDAASGPWNPKLTLANCDNQWRWTSDTIRLDLGWLEL